MTEDMMRQLRILEIERRPEACLGCGHEHSCSVHGCAVINDAATELADKDAEIASLKAENERIQQNSVSQEAYQMMCEERDAAVAELKKSCNYQFGGCYLCLNQHTDLCKSCLRDDIWADIAKNPKDNWIWHGPQKGKE